jgi:8-oxo-dGTP pyrophosphatase MutT (NUDIX family)
VSVRLASKVILVDDARRVLLFRGGEPGTPDEATWWFLPGGGRDDGETVEACAIREVFEETGFVLDAVGSVVGMRRFEGTFAGRPFVGEDTYFVVRVPPFEVIDDNWTDLEREVVREHRWWSIDELRVTTDRVYPEEIVAYVERHA